MDLAKENAALKLRVHELESRLIAYNHPEITSDTTKTQVAPISPLKKIELLTEMQVHCKSGYVILSMQGKCIEYSENINELLCLQGKNRIGLEDLISSVVPADRQSVKATIDNHLEQVLRFSEIEFRIKDADRSTQYMKLICSNSKDDVNGTPFIFLILQNITEQWRMERKLNYSEGIFRSIFSSTPLCILIYSVDNEGKLILNDMNPAARELLKISDNTLFGKPIEEALPSLAHTQYPLEYKKVATDGNPWYGKAIEYHDNRIHLVCDITAFQTLPGTTAVIYQDITERKKFEDMIRESEKKYRNLVDNSNVAVFTTTSEGRIVFINETGSRILEFPDKDSLLLEDVTRLYAVRSTRDEFLRLLKERHEVSDFRAECMTKLNRSIIISINAKLENNLISGIFIDITDKVRAEQKLIDLNRELQEINERVSVINAELRKSEALKKALLNNLPHMAWMKDKEGVYLSVNESFARSRNQIPQEVVGKTDLDLYPGKIAMKYRKEDKEVMEKRKEHFFYEKTGKLWFETYKAPIFNETGEVIGLSGISLEITSRKQAEEEIRAYSKKLAEQNEILRIINDELVRAKERAEESDKLKSSFLANMSHEIRTPMNAILGFANLLKNKNFSNERKHTFIDIINSKSKQLLQIITDIIDISKIEAGQISIFNKTFSVNAMISELYLSFENIRKQDNKSISLGYSLPFPDGNDFIYSDKIRIEQILTNFLSNAYKFTDSGSVEIGYRIEEPTIILYVKDTGIGIAPEKQKVIFDRFRQVETAHNRTYGGTGLGLAISKGLAEKMGGKIYVESELSKGSVFYLKLPYIKQPSQVLLEKTFDESVFDWSGKTILIAEDEEDNYTFLEVLLKVTGANILWARNGLEAVNLCQKNSNINLVLMDIKMPLMDGLEATQQIKNIRKTLPVIVQTAYAMSADEETCLKYGCDAYVSKPIRIESLFSLIKEHMNP
jgi:PAS domain S-box-containing protein